MSEPRPSLPPPKQRPRGAPGGRRAAGRDVRAQPRGPAAPPATSAHRGWSWRDIPAPLRWVGAVLTLLIIAIAIFIALFQWNWLRGPIDRYASARLQRPVAIHGNLAGHIWTWTPSLTADDVTVAQPAWAGRRSDGDDPAPHHRHRPEGAAERRAVVVSLVDAEHPSVSMIRDASGRNNWTFGAPTRQAQPLKLPPIRQFHHQRRAPGARRRGPQAALRRAGVVQRGS